MRALVSRGLGGEHEVSNRCDDLREVRHWRCIICESAVRLHGSIVNEEYDCEEAIIHEMVELVTGVKKKGRFDADGFYAALDAERRSRRYTWKRVADESRVSASTLTRMAQGRRPDVDSLAALVAWSGLSADAFLRDDLVKSEAEPLAMISTYLKSDRNLTPEAAEALDQLVKATYERMRKVD